MDSNQLSQQAEELHFVSSFQEQRSFYPESHEMTLPVETDIISVISTVKSHANILIPLKLTMIKVMPQLNNSHYQIFDSFLMLKLWHLKILKTLILKHVLIMQIEHNEEVS